MREEAATRRRKEILEEMGLTEEEWQAEYEERVRKEKVEYSGKRIAQHLAIGFTILVLIYGLWNTLLIIASHLVVVSFFAAFIVAFVVVGAVIRKRRLHLRDFLDL